MLSLLTSMMPTRRAMGDPSDERYWSPFGGQKTKAGVQMNEAIALTFSTVFLCTRIIAEPVAGMPIICYKRLDNGDRVISQDESPIVNLLNIAPNDQMTAYAFRESRCMHQANWGGGFAEIVWDSPRMRKVEELWPIHPARVKPNLLDNDATRKQYPYLVLNTDGQYMRMERERIMHICGTLSEDGIWGRGIIQNARETIGGALATDRHAWAYWGSGAQPKGVVMTPGLKQAEDKRAFRQQWKEIHGSPDSAEVAILPIGSDYKPIMISNQDSQFLESRQLNRKIICELYRVPTYMIGESQSKGNIEAQGVEFLMYTLYPWIRKIEAEFNIKLLAPELRPTRFFEHDFSSLLRGDLQTRMNSYRVGLCSGVYTINHCRRLENLPGIGPAGDITYVPANLFTADQMQYGNPSNPSGGQPPGSDHNGSPADDPNYQSPTGQTDPQKAFGMDVHDPAFFDAWRRRLPKTQGDELNRQLAALEQRLPERPTDWTGAARVALMDVLARMLRKESAQAQKASESKGDFDAWLREFYGKHEYVMADALRPACVNLRLAGVEKWADRLDLAAWLKARNTEALTAAFNSDSREVFARKLAAWPTERAEQLTEAILRDAA